MSNLIVTASNPDAGSLSTRKNGLYRSIAVYLAMVSTTVGTFLLVRHFGMHIFAAAASGPLATSAQANADQNGNAFEQLLIAVTFITAWSRALGSLSARLGQPPVIGEILAGILLGPSLFPKIAPRAAHFLLPAATMPALSMLAQVGIVLYMFTVGLELDFNLLRRRAQACVPISHASIVVPFILGASLALVLFPRLSTPDVPFTHFALFCGVAMSVTAFPVLARILSDRGEQKSRLGVLALTCAAVDDVTAWCLLALVVSVVGGRVSGAVWTLGLTVTYVGVMVAVVRPIVARFLWRFELRSGVLDKSSLTVVLLFALASALATELIGIHAIFGAFTAGALIPADTRLARQLLQSLQDFLVVLFLPAFFAYTGLRTQIGLVDSSQQWILCLLVLATACVGKFAGTFVAARLTGLDWTDSASLGILMNTRGLMELVVLNLGLDLKVISPTLFTMLVIMAVVTTVATMPVLHVIRASAAAYTKSTGSPPNVSQT